MREQGSLALGHRGAVSAVSKTQQASVTWHLDLGLKSKRIPSACTC